MKKKKNLLLKKLAVMFTAAFLVVQLVSCGDDDPLKGGKPGTDPGTPQPGQLDKLQDAKEATSGTFDKAQLNSLNTTAALGDKVDALESSLTVSVAKDRDKAKTRLVVVIAQDMFGNDLSGALEEKTRTLANASNVIAIIGGKVVSAKATPFNTHIDGAKIKGAKTSAGALAATDPAITNYATLKDAASKLFTVTTDSAKTKYHAKFGKLVNTDTTDVYAAAKTKLSAIISALASTADKMHANKNDIALVALDPFMSTLVVDIATNTNVNKEGSKITTVAALAPIMKFTSAGTDSALNISYPAAAKITDSVDLKGHVADTTAADSALALEPDFAAKHAFDALRTVGAAVKTTSFFASLVNGVSHDLSAKTGVTGVKFHIASVEKATGLAALDTPTGASLILDENASNTTVGLKKIVTDAADVTVTALDEAKMGDVNFPAEGKVKTLLGAEPFKSAFKQ